MEATTKQIAYIESLRREYAATTLRAQNPRQITTTLILYSIPVDVSSNAAASETIENLKAGLSYWRGGERQAAIAPKLAKWTATFGAKGEHYPVFANVSEVEAFATTNS